MVRIKQKKQVKLCAADRLYYAICSLVTGILTVLVLYPMLYIVAASMSSAKALMQGKVWIFPVDFTLIGYQQIAKFSNVWTGYRNTVFIRAPAP